MTWEINVTQEFRSWYMSLDEREDGADSERVRAAVEALEFAGPSLCRPWADRIEGSRHHNMKELRPRGGFLRVLFAFDPRRQAILLLGGDKRGDWTEWYERNIPAADDLYDEYLDELRDQGLIP
jgi:hypothetical protein